MFQLVSSDDYDCLMEILKMIAKTQNIWIIWNKFNNILNSLMVNANTNLLLLKKNIKNETLVSLDYGAYAIIKQKC